MNSDSTPVDDTFALNSFRTNDRPPSNHNNHQPQERTPLNQQFTHKPSNGDMMVVQNGSTIKMNEMPAKMATTKKVKKLLDPPDGGFGWAVVFASFMCNVIVDGIIFSFGFLLPEISAEFNENKATTAWIGSLQTGFYLIVGPVVSFLAQKYDCRTITIVGSVLTSIGFILSFFAPNVLVLYFTFGLLGGIGFGFVFLPAIVTVGYYFEKKRAFATGIAVCGSGVGTFVFPPFIQYLINAYGWRMTILILTAVTMLCALFGSMFKPLTIEVEEEIGEEVVVVEEPVAEPKPLLMRIKEARARDAAQWAASDENLSEESPSGSQNSAPPPYSEVLNIIQLNEPPVEVPKIRTRSALERKPTLTPRDEMLYSNLSLVILPRSRSISNVHRDSIPNRTEPVTITKEEILDPTETVKESCCSGFDLSLLKRPSFVLLAVSGFLCLVGFFIPFIYISDRAKLLGCSPEKCAFILSVIGITNTIGRVFCGWASDNRVNALLLNNLALTIGGIATIVSPIIFNSYATLIVYGSIFGFSVATFATLRSVITVELLGLERLTSAFGLLLLFQGLAVTIGSPIAGWFFDITGSYDYSFYLSGSAIALSGIMCYPLNIIARWEKRHLDNESNSRQSVDVA
ncbi:hypothetical protein BLOT_015572 [Blomia tropicalis]|nr:hypothetical protein BLOT_015572 [Blomia tropicalis]